MKIERQQTTPFPLRGAIWWYVLCSATIFGLIAAGSGCDSSIVYCYGDSRDYWWHPTKVIGSLVFALFLPLPHILIAQFFRTKRNLPAVLSIARSWHKVVGLLLAVLIVLGLMSAQLGKVNDQKLHVESAAGDRGEPLRDDAAQEAGPIASPNRETALSLAIACASLKKKLGRVEEAATINGYVLYKFTEIGTPQDIAQVIIFDAVGRVDAFYFENSQDRARVELMEKKACSSAQAQLPDLPGVL